MSLRAWYVLNGNVKNQGLGDFELTQVTAPTWATGKLCNQALNSGAFRWTAEQTAKILNNNELSYSAWIYVGEADTRSMIFGNDNNSTNRYFSLFQYPTKNDLYWSWNTVDGGGIWAGGSTGVLPTGKWTHIAFAYKSGYARIYINGEQVGSGSPKVNISNYSIVYNVILNNTNHRLQDIRIYDHCLSLKEVKELSKGLCLHYKLDSNADNGTINLVSGTAAEGKAVSNGGFTITKLADEPGYNYYYTRTGTTANSWPNFCMATVDRTKFTSGKPYIWSCKVRVYTNDMAGFTMRRSLISNDYTHGGAGLPQPTNPPSWVTLSSLYNPIPDSFTKSNTTYYLSSNYAPRMEFYAGNQNTSGKVYTLSADIKDVQIVEATTVQDWSEITYPTSCCDCAGLNYKDLTPVNKLSSTTNSPVYEKSKATNGVGYYKTDSLNMNFDEITVSFWYKPKSSISAQHFVYGMFNDWTHNGISIFRNADGASNLRCSTATTGTTSASATNSIVVETEKWNHIVMTWSGGASKNYLNGVLSGSTTVGTTASYINCPVLYIGNSKFNGTPASETDEASFSDFRVYATCLASADVVELYHTRASVDNDKNFYGYYLKEV